ncbi:single-stranded-DNA-specific exonuclease RecJ [Streptococcus anginosus]|uniref:Single-stranded-DNA-specific exonuclease RecJ n=1 Tax=Streptococcus anginosus subsp. whileyi CCUG 39159 TaxID=1095729 RepID=I0S9T3_STRAP|nr:single-stranded-DNA-specific exonuclease RecJ [Streptococcus anginosus]AGU83294.1 single-stranded-DNA-specific exonuclease RecJ [Streptococcus anginosus C238]EID20136.1 single-stranded-DNA-specific exonuclease RecJ [Streptococcus anginosus subsp. whileyi CCUG 39159]MDB8661035.1 single-stranded-DNA-specific exonuclease RecJ [Streptococcus anginosus]MDP1385031.1 single-stranded-DNA-specific exonuclease RecJ [Streptococcus anginosus]QQT09571.1 single-stranded-DNA-specific exonuclease RecJ [Str
MITSKYDWQIATNFSDESFIKKAKKLGLEASVANLVYQRGIQTEEALRDFLEPSLDQLHDPYELHDMDKAVTRIRQAIENYEQILIYGDYDADGMTSASIVKEALEQLGAECQVYLPNRFTDGYGPNASVYKYFIENQGISLIVTVDNGVAGHEAIELAQSMGVDVIVTDHHSMPEVLPDAYAIVHPEHPEAEYPFKHLAGCGVAFKLATALLEEVQVELLDLVAIGTIADMVSLTDENRILVKYGLSVLKNTQRIGLQELFKIAGIQENEVDEETVGFQIAPRLNALGRLDDPNPAIELLTGFDEEEARDIALMINQKNEERKEIVQKIYDEAKTMIDLNKPVQVLAGEGWNLGVLGIVAGRLLEELHQPVIVLNIENDLAKGSARSIEAVDIFEALDPHRDLFVAFGGHAGAAGMTLEASKLEALSQVLVAYIEDNQVDLSTKNELFLDEELSLPDLTLETLKNFEKLAPFGMDNKKPVFYLKDFKIENARTMGAGNTHLKLKISQADAVFEVVAFGLGNLATEFSQTKNLELAVTLSVNKWNGQTSLQLMLVDARVNGIQLFNIRGKNAPLPENVPVLRFSEEMPNLEKSRAVVVYDLPERLNQLKVIIQQGHFEAIYFKNEIAQPYYLTGFGTRDQFAKLYKTIYQFPEFDIRYKLKELAAYLKIDPILLIKMIQIFEELDFVTIQDGVMQVNKKAEKKAIENSHIYQELKKTVKEQELMALGTVQEIYDYLIEKDEFSN